MAKSLRLGIFTEKDSDNADLVSLRDQVCEQEKAFSALVHSIREASGSRYASKEVGKAYQKALRIQGLFSAMMTDLA